MPQSLSVSEKEVQYSLAIHEAGLSWLSSKKQLMLWAKSGCKKQVLKVLLEDCGLYAQVLSVKKTQWTSSREWVRSVPFNNRIVTISCYFYCWEDHLARNVVRKLKAYYLQTRNHIHFRRIQTVDCQITGEQSQHWRNKETDGKGETSGDDVTWQSLSIATLLSMLLLNMEI